jgi:hypothetical protein
VCFLSVQSKREKETRMSRTIANVIIDVTAAVLFLGMIATGYVLRFPLPPGTNKLFTLWDLTRHEWGSIHFWISLGLLTILFVHVILHWQWIVTVLGKRLHLVTSAPPPLLRSGITVLVILGLAFAVFAWATHSSVQSITAPLPGVCPPEDTVAGVTTNHTRQVWHAQQLIIFWRDIYPLLEKKCLSCHGPRQQFGNFRVDRRDDFLRDAGNGPLVVPGKSADSRLITLVSGARKEVVMADRHTLAEHEVTLLKAWIDAGADWSPRPDSRE